MPAFMRWARGGYRHGEERDYRPEDCRDPKFHGNAGALSAPRGGHPRRPGDGGKGRRGPGAFLQRRDGRDSATAGYDPTHGREAGDDYGRQALSLFSLLGQGRLNPNFITP